MFQSSSRRSKLLFLLDSSKTAYLRAFDLMSAVLDGTQDYCQFETFTPRCWQSEVVVMKQAFYGRRHVSRCTEAEGEEFAQNPRYFGCSADVTAILHTRCSGKKQCEVKVFDQELASTKPCVSGLMMFLEASYSCVEGALLCHFYCV